MAKSLYAHIDEHGNLILPPEIAREWGIERGSELKVELDGRDLRLKPPLTQLSKIYVEITNRCNLNCSTCMRNVWNADFGCMEAENFERILTGLAGFSPPPEIFFGGYGEPLSHPDCLSMIAEAKSRGHPVSLITNGVLLTEGVSRELLELQLDKLWVSLDGASANCYTDVRLGNELPHILDNLNTFRRLQLYKYGFSSWGAHPRLGIAFVAMRRNILDLPEVVRIGLQIGATEFSITNVLAHTQALKAESLYDRSIDQVGSPESNRWKPLLHIPRMDIDKSTAEAIIRIVSGNHRLNLFGGELGKNGGLCPFVERGSLSIRWDGKVSPCLPLLYTHTHYLDSRQRISIEYFVGDIKEKKLPDIWYDESYQKLRRLLQEFDFSPCTVCNSCEMADSNLEDCYGNVHPTCGGCLWAQGLIRCP